MKYMETIVSKEELDSIRKIKGEVTGDCIKNDLDYVFKKEGKEGLERVESVMANLGFLVNHKKLRVTDIYPVAFPITLIMVIKRLFNYSENDLEKMGRLEARISSTIIRLFMKHFISLNVLANNAQKMWGEHYKMGNISVIEQNAEKGYVYLKIENFKTHIFICHVLGGYFAGMLEVIVGKKVTVKEIKCENKGDEYHEFHFNW